MPTTSCAQDYREAWESRPPSRQQADERPGGEAAEHGEQHEAEPSSTLNEWASENWISGMMKAGSADQHPADECGHTPIGVWKVAAMRVPAESSVTFCQLASRMACEKAEPSAAPISIMGSSRQFQSRCALLEARVCELIPSARPAWASPFPQTSGALVHRQRKLKSLSAGYIQMRARTNRRVTEPRAPSAMNDC